MSQKKGERKKPTMDHDKYIVEREFLCKISIQDLIIRIIKTHMENFSQQKE